LTETPDRLSERQVTLLAIAAAIVTANAYYIHPIIALVAESFDVRPAWVGLVPAANQVALAVGILFLLPLGDRLSNRRMISLALTAQVIALLTMALADSFRVFVAASTALGFFTITPYLLPAYASKRVRVGRLGHVTAVLAAGVITGTLLSRTASGVVGEYLSWRTIYWIAAALMIAATVALRRMLDDDVAAPGGAAAGESYLRLIASLWPLMRYNRHVILSGVIQGLSFGIFLLVWMGIGLHLTSEAVGLGVDDVGYLGIFSIVNAVTTPRLGRWADRVGPERARVVMSLVQMAGVAMLFAAGDDFWYFSLPIVVLSIAGPMIDVTGRMTCLAADPAIRTRLMSLFITLMFLGGGVGSWAGTIAYDLGGWTLNVGLAMGTSAVIVLLSLSALRVAGR